MLEIVFSHGEHTASATARVVDGKMLTDGVDFFLLAAHHQRYEQANNVFRGVELSGHGVRRFFRPTNHRFESRAHHGVIHHLRAQVGFHHKSLRDGIEQSGTVEARIDASEVARVAILVGEVVENIFYIVGEAFEVNLEVVGNVGRHL